MLLQLDCVPVYTFIGVIGRLFGGNLLIRYIECRREKLQYSEGRPTAESWYRIIFASMLWERSTMPFWNNNSALVGFEKYPCLSAMDPSSDDPANSPPWSVLIMCIPSEIVCVSRKMLMIHWRRLD